QSRIQHGGARVAPEARESAKRDTESCCPLRWEELLGLGRRYREGLSHREWNRRWGVAGRDGAAQCLAMHNKDERRVRASPKVQTGRDRVRQRRRPDQEPTANGSGL